MTIKPIDQAPNPYNGIYNPRDTPETRAMLYADGYREMPPIPEPADGYTRVIQPVAVDIDGINGEWDMTGCDRLTSEIEAERKAQELALNGERWAYENAYLTMCDQLTGGTEHTKLGFAELEAIILAVPDEAQRNVLTLQLFKLNAALVYHGGTRWWDSCVWHPELAQ